MDAGRNLRVELQTNELPLVAGSSGLWERPFDMP
jgi:UDP-3-O-acyl-N-acetylglucosamine deacetylase